jgi:asparagine synthase (glutamine-hydrolysing)
MCGINGIVRLEFGASLPDFEELRRARDSMASRGPDGSGQWRSEDGEVALGHRRLAIIDLSPTGAQPMAFADGRYRIVLNGEIYNYRELRDELVGAGVALQTQSDTEVVLALFAREGVAMLARLRGMYAFAIWDEAQRKLTLARDPYGIKPLYYAAAGGAFRFASQVKALEASGAVSLDLDPAGLVGFLLWGSVPEPFTIRRGIRALPAGHVLEVEAGRVSEPRPASVPEPHSVDVGAAIAASIEAHLVADVPVGLFLSAGLDSTLVAALARRAPGEPLVAITATFEAFEGGARDEGPLAAEVARTLGLRVASRRFTRRDLEALWPRALAAMDQPTIDGFNTYLVAHAAHEAGLKVVLSGLGGDELFGSYPSFQDVPRWARWVERSRRVPGLAGAWPKMARGFGGRKPKLAGLLAHGDTLAGAYFLRRGLFLPEELPALIGAERAAEGLAAYDPVRDAERFAAGASDAWEAVHRMESGLYLKNQLLRDADWAAMAHSVELRVPLVDARLQATIAAARFEPARTEGKAALVRRLAPELPEAIFQQRKRGFAVPLPPSRELARRVLQAFGTREDALSAGRA